jgi:hypothetical protein
MPPLEMRRPVARARSGLALVLLGLAAGGEAQAAAGEWVRASHVSERKPFQVGPAA